MEKSIKEKTFFQGLMDGMPTALGYIGIGIACGVIAAPYMNPFEMFLMSFLVYAGSAQFVMISLFATSAGLADITLTVFLINLRLFLLSLHTTTVFQKEKFLQTIGIASLLTDETYGVLMGERLQTEHVTTSWMHGNNLAAYLAWGGATVIGTVLGDLLPNPEAFGLDFALVAMFIGIFASQFLAMLSQESLKKLVLILGSVTLTFFVLSTFITSSLAILISTLVGCSVGVYLDGK